MVPWLDSLSTLLERSGASHDFARRASRACPTSYNHQYLSSEADKSPDACCRPHVSTPALVGFECSASSPHMLVHLAVTNRPGNEIGRGLPSIRFSYLTDDSSDCPVACTLEARGEGRGTDCLAPAAGTSVGKNYLLSRFALGCPARCKMIKRPGSLRAARSFG